MFVKRDFISGDGSKIELEISCPKELSEDYICEYQFIGDGCVLYKSLGRGVDSLQALIHAVLSAKKYIDQSNYNFSWVYGLGENDHGIPWIISTGFDPCLSSRIDEMIANTYVIPEK